ncbi:MAG: ABC transporter permease [Hamadaea sp.]|uniref:ABC transporter permease n=1 Tax=Hamadaea sp. TaxID=2024425 RepID=UPI00180BCEC9|nr:ABC transporter permease [Hamadaea sp.]NUR72396.1 ABC transporter permease [Hamadaea sp.]NUT22166.1 ABC transporter permease [Hamadaea sp.]
MSEPNPRGTEPADSAADSAAVGVLDVAASEEGAKAPKAIEGRSPGQLAWMRLRRDRTARGSIWVLGFFIVIAILAPLIEKVYGLGPTVNSPDLLDRSGLPLGYFGGIDFTTNNASNHIHILGVMPGTGWDIFMQFVYGARTSLIVAALATLLSVVIGVVIGIVAGYLGGWIDQALTWFIDYMLAFPFVLMAIAIIPIVNTYLADSSGYVPPAERMATIIVVFSLFGWMSTARLVRGQVISLREREYVDAARAAGAGRGHIMFKQILPNLWAPILVTFSLSLPATVTAEAALSFLGIGVQQPTPDWGRMINDSLSYMQTDWMYLVIPGFSIWALVLAFNLFGDATRDALDPKSSR